MTSKHFRHGSRWRRPAALGLALATMLPVVACGDSGSGSGGGQQVTIGLVATFSGPASVYGERMKRTAELAIPMLEKEHPDIDFELVTADDACDPAQGIQATEKMVLRDEIDVLIGYDCSNVAIASLPVIKREKVPTLAPVAADAAIWKEGAGNVFMTRSDTEQQADFVSKVIIERLKPKKVAVVFENSAAGQSSSAYFKDRFDKAGLSQDAFQVAADVQDFVPIARKVQATGAEVTLTQLRTGQLAQFAKALEVVGFQTQLIDTTWATPEVHTLAGPEVDGRLFIDSFVAEAEESADAKEFVSTFNGKYGENPDGHDAATWMTFELISQIVGDGATDREAIMAALPKVSLTESVVGPVTFSEEGQWQDPLIHLLSYDDKSKKISIELNSNEL